MITDFSQDFSTVFLPMLHLDMTLAVAEALNPNKPKQCCIRNTLKWFRYMTLVVVRQANKNCCVGSKFLMSSERGMAKQDVNMAAHSRSV